LCSLFQGGMLDSQITDSQFINNLLSPDNCGFILNRTV
jgi:hypothetical protein